MAQKVEFKEKTFEQQFGIEIGRRTNIFYSPDQCDERFVGFDAAFFLPFPQLLSIAPYRRFSRYRRMTGVSVRNLDKIVGDLSQRMPPFKFNIFAQYKRPSYLKSSGAGEWSHWNKPYFRYETTPHQQAVLEKFEDASAGRAAAIYASPAFRTHSELWGFIEDGKVVENSNIASVRMLCSHHKYTYISAGGYGKGHSEAEDINSNDIDSIIIRGIDNDSLPFNRHVKETAKSILEAVNSSREGSIIFNLASRVRGLQDPELEVGSFLWAIIVIEVFSEVFDITPMMFG